jgi:hypothetical protein
MKTLFISLCICSTLYTNAQLSFQRILKEDNTFTPPAGTEGSVLWQKDRLTTIHKRAWGILEIGSVCGYHNDGQLVLTYDNDKPDIRTEPNQGNNCDNLPSGEIRGGQSNPINGIAKNLKI